MREAIARLTFVRPKGCGADTLYRVAATTIACADKVAVTVPTVDVCLKVVAFRTYTGGYEWATSTKEDQQRKFHWLDESCHTTRFYQARGVWLRSVGEKRMPEMDKPRITHGHSPDLGRRKNTGDCVLSAADVSSRVARGSLARSSLAANI